MTYQVLQYRGNDLVSANIYKEKERADKKAEGLKQRYPSDDISIRPMYSVMDGMQGR
jgi:hypothetical protein